MIEVSVLGSWSLVELSGEFDVANADEIQSVVSDLAARAVTDVTVDLSRVTLMTAAGLHALEAANDRIESVDGRLLLVGAGGHIRRVFEVTGLESILPLTAPTPTSPPVAALTAGHDFSEEARPGTVSALSAQLFDLSNLILTSQSVSQDLRRVARVAVDMVPGTTAASITLVATGRPRSAVITGLVAIEVDVAQYVVDEGPCLDAARRAEPIRVDVLDTDERFVHLAPLAHHAGIRAVLSLPVTTNGVTIGSLNVYSNQMFPSDAEQVAGIIASQAATAVVKSEIYAALRRATDVAQRRLHVDQDINIAQGALAELQDCSLDQARNLLHSAAVVNRESLHHVARRIIGSLGHPAGP